MVVEHHRPGHHRGQQLGFSIRFIAGASVLCAAASILATPPLVGIFTRPDSPVYQLAVEGNRLCSIALLFVGLNVFASGMFTALSLEVEQAVLPAEHQKAHRRRDGVAQSGGDGRPLDAQVQQADTFYTMVDGLFVSNLIGTDALSAINLTAPAIGLITAVSGMLAAGGNILISPVDVLAVSQVKILCPIPTLRKPDGGDAPVLRGGEAGSRRPARTSPC